MQLVFQSGTQLVCFVFQVLFQGQADGFVPDEFHPVKGLVQFRLDHRSCLSGIHGSLTSEACIGAQVSQDFGASPGKNSPGSRSIRSMGASQAPFQSAFNQIPLNPWRWFPIFMGSTEWDQDLAP